MPINYTVRADVIDIRTSAPQSGDRFLVDTNVWYWLTYPAASSSALRSPARSYQIAHYPPFIQDALGVGAALCCSGLSFSELAHRIESAQRELSRYSSSNPKEYRHNYPTERNRVVREITTAWSQVVGFASVIDSVIDEPTLNASINRCQAQALDGYDLFILEAMQQNFLTQVITDDGDYVTVPGIQVFTANQGAITAAQYQGKLIAP